MQVQNSRKGGMEIKRKTNTKWYDGHELLTRNAKINFIHGGRGRGKTHFFKMFALTRPDPSMWLIRSDKQLMETGKGFLDDLPDDIQERYKLTWVIQQEEKSKKKTVYPCIIDENNEPKVYFSSMNVPNKGIPFPKIQQLIFDEYLIFETRYKKYEPGEVIAFLDILQTIARNKRKFRCFMIANEINPINPYFAFFKIEGFHKDRHFTWIKKGKQLMEWVQDSDEWLEDYMQSAFHDIVEGTDYDDYMKGTRGLVDITLEIKKHPEEAEYVLNLVYGNTYLAIWRLFSDYYVTDKRIDKTKASYGSKIEDTGKNRYYDQTIKRQIRDLIAQNKIYAESNASRLKVMEWIR